MASSRLRPPVRSLNDSQGCTPPPLSVPADDCRRRWSGAGGWLVHSVGCGGVVRIQPAVSASGSPCFKFLVMSPQVAAAIIAAIVSGVTLIGTLAAQYLSSRATRRDLKEQRKYLNETLAEQRTRTLNERFASAAGQRSLVGDLCSFRGHPGPGGHRQHAGKLVWRANDTQGRSEHPQDHPQSKPEHRNLGAERTGTDKPVLFR